MQPRLHALLPTASLLLLGGSLTLSGCKDGGVVLPGEGTGSDDTGGGGSGDDGGSGGSGDSGGDEGGDSGGDSGGDDGGEPVFTFIIGGEDTDMAVDLHATNIFTGEFEDRVAAAGAVDGEVVISMVPPEEDEMYSLADDGYPDTYVLFYRPGIWEDSDGDAELSGDEAYAGIGLHVPFYVSGPLPEGWPDIGIEEGWNVLRNRVTDVEPYVVPVDQIPIEANLEHRESVELGGTVEASGDDVGFTVISALTLFEGAWVEPLVDEVYTSGDWSASLDGEPDWDHIVDWEGDGFEFAYEFPLLYHDYDASDSVSDGDDLLSFACTDANDLAAAIWVPPTDNIAFATALVTYSLPTGWSAVGVTEGDGFQILDEDEATSLTMDTGCGL